MGTAKLNDLLFRSSIEFPCSYIKGKLEKRFYVSIATQNCTNIVSELTKRGFRRNYNHMYIPSCKDCNSCISSRININKFIFSRSNKRNLKINNDLSLVVNKDYNEKRFNLFKYYCSVRHTDGGMKSMTENEFIAFFHRSINETKVFDLIDQNQKLYGSILLDILSDGYSAVYSFFDPDLNKRGLGKNLILKTIDTMKKSLGGYLYLGYWVKESDNMNYKSSFNNIEYFKDGQWTSSTL